MFKSHDRCRVQVLEKCWIWKQVRISPALLCWPRSEEAATELITELSGWNKNNNKEGTLFPELKTLKLSQSGKIR